MTTFNGTPVDIAGYISGAGGTVPVLGGIENEITGNATLVLTIGQADPFYQLITSDGSSTGIIEVEVPLNPGKCWLFQNATTEGFAINVIGSSGTGVSIPPNGFALCGTDGVNVYSAGGFTPGADLSGSSVAQYVSNISGPGGTGGTVNLGDGFDSLTFLMRPATGFTAPTLTFQGSLGLAGTNGHLGGPLEFISGKGGSATGPNNIGALGGPVFFQGGQGGNSTGTSGNSTGGNVGFSTGNPGIGGSGGAGLPGTFAVTVGGQITCFQLQAATSDYLAMGGPTAVSGSNRCANSGLLRFPSSTGLPIMAVRNPGNTADVSLVAASAPGGNPTMSIGSAAVNAINITASTTNFLSSSLMNWFISQGQGTKTTQVATAALTDAALATVAASTNQLVYTSSAAVPSTSTGFAKCKLVARATTAPAGGSIGDSYISEVNFGFKNVGSGIVAVGTPTVVSQAADTSLDGLVSIVLGGTTNLEFTVDNTSAGNLVVTLTVEYILN
jgi:hypothetical protein